MLYLPDDSTFLHKISSWPPSWNYDVMSEIRLRQWMRIYLTNNPAKFHPDATWKDGALGFWGRSPQRANNKNNNNNDKMSCDMRAVPDLKKRTCIVWSYCIKLGLFLKNTESTLLAQSPSWQSLVTNDTINGSQPKANQVRSDDSR